MKLLTKPYNAYILSYAQLGYCVKRSHKSPKKLKRVQR